MLECSLVFCEIALATGLQPVAPRDKVGRRFGLDLSQLMRSRLSVRNASPAIGAQMAEIKMREFMGDGYEPGRRRMVTVVGEPIQVLALRRLRPCQRLDPAAFGIAGIEFNDFDLLSRD